MIFVLNPNSVHDEAPNKSNSASCLLYYSPHVPWFDISQVILCGTTQVGAKKNDHSLVLRVLKRSVCKPQSKQEASQIFQTITYNQSIEV